MRVSERLAHSRAKKADSRSGSRPFGDEATMILAARTAEFLLRLIGEVKPGK
jgi:hypothetical protein